MATQEATPVGLLLRRAQSWQEAEKMHQAIATYFKLVEYFPETEEARCAQEQLLGLAQRFEAEGKAYMAMSICDRLSTTLTPPTRVSILSPMGRPVKNPLL